MGRAAHIGATFELWGELWQLVCHKISDCEDGVGVVEVRVCQQ
jgi:hypothetical protein